MITRKMFSLLRRSVILVKGTANRPGREFEKREIVKRAEGKVSVHNWEKKIATLTIKSEIY